MPEETLIARRATHLNTGQALQERNFLVEEGSNVSGYSQTLAEIDSATGSVAVLNAFRPEGIGAQTKLEGGQAQPQWLLGDALGSVRALASEGSATEKYDYAAFGEGIRGDREKTRYAFTGQVADGSLQLQYHRARWLNTVLSQWRASDPILDFRGNFANQYNYVSKSSMNNIDISGLSVGFPEIFVTALINGIVSALIMTVVTSWNARAFSFAGAGRAFIIGFIVTFVMAAFTSSFFLFGAVNGKKIVDILVNFLARPEKGAWLFILYYAKLILLGAISAISLIPAYVLTYIMDPFVAKRDHQKDFANNKNELIRAINYISILYVNNVITDLEKREYEITFELFYNNYEIFCEAECDKAQEKAYNFLNQNYHFQYLKVRLVVFGGLEGGAMDNPFNAVVLEPLRWFNGEKRPYEYDHYGNTNAIDDFINNNNIFHDMPVMYAGPPYHPFPRLIELYAHAKNSTGRISD